MKAAVFEQFGGDVVVVDVPDPTPPVDGVVVQVRANGVCRSDWHAWVGHDSSIALPHVPGHELAGIVVATGADVASVRVGDRITVPFVLGCGRCAMCASGNEHICDHQYQPGFDGWGAFAEYVALPHIDRNAVTLPDDMSFVAAAGLGCRFATSFRAVVDQGEVTGDDTLAVWGCGGVGLSSVMIGAALGARVIAIDIDPVALDLARSFGATHVVDASAVADPAAAVRELTDGGVRVSIDALGSTATSVSSIRSLRKRGRHIQVGLMIGDDARPVIPMWRLHASEVEFHGSHGMQAWRYPAMLDMVRSGELQPDALVTRTVSLGEGAEHLMAMADFPGNGFVVIDDFSR